MQSAQADAVDEQLVVGDVVDLHAERAHGVDSRLRVGGAAEAAHASLPVGERPTSTARCEMDLSPGTAMWPARNPAGSIFIVSTGETTTW